MKYKKILVVTSRYPVPVRGGDKLRIFQIIKYLSKKNKVDLISIGNSKTKINYINKQFVFKNTFSNKIYQIIKSIILREPMQIGLFKLPEMKDKVNIISKNYDVIIFHLIRTTYYLPLKFKGKKILEMTDLISKNYDTVDESLSNLNPLKQIYKFEKKSLKIYENKMIKLFNFTVFVNKKDLKKKLQNNNKIKIIGNGTFQKKNIFLHKKQKKNIVFFGNINSLANRSACFEFIKFYLPILKNKYPKLKFIILGNCSWFLRKFFNLFGVQVYSNITNLSNYSKNTLAGICNVKIQSGLQNKILDYASIGLPIFVNKVSNNFKHLNSNDILVYNDKEDFFKKLKKLYHNKNLQKKLSKNCFKKIAKYYNWEKVLKNYDLLI